MLSKKSRLLSPKRFAAMLFPLCCLPFIASTSSADIASSLPQATCVGWNKVATITTQGKTEDEGFKGTITRTLDTRTGRYIAVADYGMYKVADGFDGQFDWSQDWSGASHYLNSRAAQSISVTKAWLRRRGWCEPNTGQTKVIGLPDNTNGKSVEAVWRVTPRNGIDAIVRFGNRDTGLLRSFEILNQFDTSIRRYGDWRDVGAGVLFPFTESSGDPDEDASESTWVAPGETRRASARRWCVCETTPTP